MRQPSVPMKIVGPLRSLVNDFLSFHLPDVFLKEYQTKKPNWGFDIGGGNSLSELTYIAKYSRKKEDGTKERWWETCVRCVEGTYSIFKDHCKHNRTPWNEFKAQKSAQEAYDMMFAFKWSPPGRGLANMGTSMVHEENNNASLNNCAALTTEKLSTHSAYEATMPFVRLMEMSMHGVGVGFDTRGAGKLVINEPNEENPLQWIIPDTREGWAESLGLLLESYFFKNRNALKFDYSLLRPAGSPLKRFGGTASGPEPLRKMHEGIRAIFVGRNGTRITSRDIVDIMNMIGKAVVAGGARRSALIALGDPNDEDYVNLKNWELPENAARTGPDGWAWTSNNSVWAYRGQDLTHLASKIAINGEPGVIYLDTMQQYGRLIDEPNNKDHRATLVNPCAEISLEPHEFCCLSELYPINNSSYAEFERSIKHAYMYAKAVTLVPSIWPETNEVITRNRRIGVSMTGVVEFIETRSWNEMKDWADKGYEKISEIDHVYSEWLGVRESIKLTTVKPAGTTSLIAGTTPGAHWPTTAGDHWRLLRFLAHDPIVLALIEAGYHVEPDVNDPDQTLVAYFPTKGVPVRSERDVSIWEKALLPVMLQRFWADNMVSVTVSFDKDREPQEIDPLLRSLEGQLKSISFLPISSGGTSYVQAPYQPLDSEQAAYERSLKRTLDMDILYGVRSLEAQGEKFCNTDHCEITTPGLTAEDLLGNELAALVFPEPFSRQSSQQPTALQPA